MPNFSGLEKIIKMELILKGVNIDDDDNRYREDEDHILSCTVVNAEQYDDRFSVVFRKVDQQ